MLPWTHRFGTPRHQGSISFSKHRQKARGQSLKCELVTPTMSLIAMAAPRQKKRRDGNRLKVHAIWQHACRQVQQGQPESGCSVCCTTSPCTNGANGSQNKNSIGNVQNGGLLQSGCLCFFKAIPKRVYTGILKRRHAAWDKSPSEAAGAVLSSTSSGVAVASASGLVMAWASLTWSVQRLQGLGACEESGLKVWGV